MRRSLTHASVSGNRRDDRGIERRPARLPALRNCPRAARPAPVTPQQRLRSYGEARRPLFGQQATRRRQESSVAPTQVRASYLATRDAQLMARNNDLEVSGVLLG